MSTSAGPGSVSPCFYPGDDQGDARLCFHPAAPATAGVNLCHHPADDLADDLHLALTGIDEHHLAALA